MTNQEAIKVLKGNKRVAKQFPENKRLNEAIDMGTNALRQVECFEYWLEHNFVNGLSKEQTQMVLEEI